jgi:uncharacterized protein
MVDRSELLTPETLSFMPMLDLFQQLRDAGMKLTIEDYELLRQVLGEDYQPIDWEDLRDTCRLLWVKPSLNYDSEIFDREFDLYRAEKEGEFDRWLATISKSFTPTPDREINFGEFPQLPPRRKTITESDSASIVTPESEPADDESTDAVNLERPKSPRYNSSFTVQVPISQAVFQRGWRTLRKPIIDRRITELDILGTVERIGREGFFSDVVTRPVLKKKAELLLLVDDSNAMLPFAPAIQPLIQIALDRQISPARIYRFNQYPSNNLFEWQHPLREVPLAKILERSHRQRTAVIIVSDAGAVSPLYHQERVAGTGKFLKRLLPCVREVLWLNPLPESRWVNTTAATIQTAIAGRMIPLEVGKWQQLARTREFRSGVQLWSLIQN